MIWEERDWLSMGVGKMYWSVFGWLGGMNGSREQAEIRVANASALSVLSVLPGPSLRPSRQQVFFSQQYSVI
jgi:hypothetical protein